MPWGTHTVEYDSGINSALQCVRWLLEVTLFWILWKAACFHTRHLGLEHSSTLNDTLWPCTVVS